MDRQRTRERFNELGHAPLDIAIDRPQQQLSLAAERRIKAGPAETRRLAQIVERGGLIALGPKQFHRAFQRGIRVELTGTGHRAFHKPVSDNYGPYSP